MFSTFKQVQIRILNSMSNYFNICKILTDKKENSQKYLHFLKI